MYFSIYCNVAATLIWLNWSHYHRPLLKFSITWTKINHIWRLISNLKIKPEIDQPISWDYIVHMPWIVKLNWKVNTGAVIVFCWLETLISLRKVEQKMFLRIRWKSQKNICRAYFPFRFPLTHKYILNWVLMLSACRTLPPFKLQFYIYIKTRPATRIRQEQYLLS